MKHYRRDELTSLSREAQEEGQVIENFTDPTPAPWEQPWDKERFNTLFLSRGPVSDYAITKAIAFLYGRQTADERTSQVTKEVNGRGFTGFDAPFLSSLGARLARGQGLTQGMWAALRRTDKRGFCVLAKYHAQLQEAVKDKAKAKTYAAIDRVEAQK